MSFCSKDFRKIFPYGRFNTSTTNFKLYPRLNPDNNVGITSITTKSVCVDSSGNKINASPDGVCKEVFQPNVQKRHVPLFQNTTYKMTQKEQIAFFSKIGGRIR